MAPLLILAHSGSSIHADDPGISCGLWTTVAWKLPFWSWRYAAVVSR
jgi:hypothetical protein